MKERARQYFVLYEHTEQENRTDSFKTQFLRHGFIYLQGSYFLLFEPLRRHIILHALVNILTNKLK